MTYLPDLSRCDFGPYAELSDILSIGWLDRSQSFRQGLCSREFFRKLVSLIQKPFAVPFASAGSHLCGFCQFSGGGVASFEGMDIPHGSHREIFVPGNGVIYCSPEIIAHYVDAHAYLPPEPFIEAVAKCPDPATMDFKKAVLANGGKSLLSNSTV